MSLAEDGYWSFNDVEGRIEAAFATLRALPDREAGWLRTKTMSIFREVLREHGDYFETSPVTLGVRTADVDAMNEALGWCEWVPGEARRIIGLVMTETRGETVSWTHIRAVGGYNDTTDTLRKRYSRAITVICSKLNCGKYAIKTCQ